MCACRQNGWSRTSYSGSNRGAVSLLPTPQGGLEATVKKARSKDPTRTKPPVAVKVVENAAQKSADAVSGWGNAVAGSIGAIGGFTAALSSMDFSSPEAAMASLMALSFAVTQAQTAFAGFAAITKASTAAEAAETTAANVKSTASETS